MSYALGTSNLAQWPTIIHAIERSPWPHRRILDVGAGYGKAGVLLREYLNEKPDDVDAVEVDPGLLEMIRNDGLWPYGCVWRVPAQEIAQDVWRLYDTVLMADVIEHIPKDEALALLGRIPGQIVVSTPLDAEVDEHARQAADIPPLERHVAQWTRTDFHRTGRLELSIVAGPQLVVRLGPRDAQRGRG